MTQKWFLWLTRHHKSLTWEAQPQTPTSTFWWPRHSWSQSITEVAELNLLDNAQLSRAPLPPGPCEAGTEVAVDWTEVSSGDWVAFDEVSVRVGCPWLAASPSLLFLFLIAANKAALRPPTPRPAGGGALAPPDTPLSILSQWKLVYDINKSAIRFIL